MNRVDRALAEARIPYVGELILDETVALARERLDSGAFRSWSAARDSAARTVAARHKMMPGPIIVALLARRGA